MKKYLFRSICKGIFMLCAVVILGKICGTGVSATLYDELPTEQKSLYSLLAPENQRKLEDFRKVALTKLHPMARTKAMCKFSTFLEESKAFQESTPEIHEDRTIKDRTIIEIIMGLAFFNDGSIAVCNQNLKLFLNFGKSSLNGKFQYLHFSSCKDNTKIKIHFPNFSFNFYNKWTMRILPQAKSYNKAKVATTSVADQTPLFIQLDGQPSYVKENSNLFARQAVDNQYPIPLKKRAIDSKSTSACSSSPAPVDNQTPTIETRSSSANTATSKSTCSITNLCIPLYLTVSLRTDENGQTTVLDTNADRFFPSQYSYLISPLSEYLRKADQKI